MRPARRPFAGRADLRSIPQRRRLPSLQPDVRLPCSSPSSRTPALFFWSAIAWASSASPAGTLGGAGLGATPRLRRPAPTACRSASRASGRGRSCGSTSTTPPPSGSSPPSGRASRRIRGGAGRSSARRLILFTTYFQVEVSVAINDWYGPFYDLIQAALGKTREVTIGEFYAGIVDFLGIALVAVFVGVLSLLLRQPLRLPLAHGDERLLHEPLAAAPPHRGRLAARAGGHHALLLDDGEPRASASSTR